MDQEKFHQHVRNIVLVEFKTLFITSHAATPFQNIWIIDRYTLIYA